MIQEIQYVLWKMRAQKAVKAGKTTVCIGCADPIVPGDFVGIAHPCEGSEPKLIHAGFHFSLSKMHAFCETGAIGCAVWDGTQAVGTGESCAEKALRTGKPQIG